jgi:type I restriction-modification system DNA methylase subunit
VVGDWALKKGLATFFTQVPAAYLLLHLANPPLCRLADFACGSGTLLVAAYSAMNSQHRFSLLKSGLDKHPADIERDFHSAFMKSCHAFDVLGYASQITALNLALHSPETPITGSSPTYTMPLGYRETDQTVSLGSLEFARTDMKLDQIFAQVIKRGVETAEKNTVINLLRLEPFDLIVMNPPFSRTTGRGGRSGGGLFGFMSDKSVRKIVLDDYTALRNDVKAELYSKARKLLKNTSLDILIKDDELRAYR